MLLYLTLGTIFGLVLSRSGAADYNYIQGMFLFERFQLYGIIGAAVVFTAVGLRFIKRTAAGRPISIAMKSLNRGTIPGSVLFGIGWSMTGMCPGPMFVNIGEGKIYAVAALAGALVGAAAFGSLYPSLQRVLRLPAIGESVRTKMV